MKLSVESFKHTGGDDLKLYGYIGAAVSTPENPMKACGEGEIVALWELIDGQYQSVNAGETWKPSSPQIVEIPEVSYGKGEELCLMGTLYDNNRYDWFGGQDEYLGELYKTVYFNDSWNSLQTISFRGRGELGVDVLIKVSE
jgi:hypothetical protein